MQDFDTESDADSETPPSTYSAEEKNWALAMHLSQFAGYAVPLLGFIAPIVIWQLKKDEFPALNAHGRNITNWMISVVIYSIIGFMLAFVLIGIPFLMLLVAVAVIFPIIGGIKASEGVAWKYPGTISFL
ncbi:DUF4870 domain-containing protein [Planctomicrobium sp. SH668]|uniref:DUF4870 domain-containing protein n=1 Tax=Planctomicrobium sp. SH668 TaxID=3448126 RepID=UPI003F5B005F